MLKKVEIENFQSHKKTVVEFKAGTNVIIGKSDTGKSSVLRAINWAITNRPLGDFFRSEWGGETRVAIETDDGFLIERIRSVTKNQYKLNGEILKAFGTEVPEEITKILRIDEHSIHAQMEVPFLLGTTPGEASKLLNKAASLEEIDLVTSGIRGQMQKINSGLKFQEGELERVEGELEKYITLPQIEKLLQKAEKGEAKAEDLKTEIISIKNKVEKIKEIQTFLDKTKAVPGLLNKQEITQKLYESFQKESENLKKLKDLFLQIGKIQSHLEKTKNIELLLQKIYLSIEKQKELREEQKQQKRLSLLSGQIKQTKKAILLQGGKINGLESQYSILTPEICPLCGGKMRDI